MQINKAAAEREQVTISSKLLNVSGSSFKKQIRPMKLKDAPIQRKLINVILLTCAVVLLIMCSFYMVFEFFTFRNIVKTNVMSLAAVVASNSTAALAFDSQKDAEEMLNALKAEKHIVAASLYDLQGNLCTISQKP